jgi:hypothetical protein
MEPQVKPGTAWLQDDPAHPLEKVMWLQVIGRLKPGVSQPQAAAEANVRLQADCGRGVLQTS